jgi:sigma-B regulation protein RsbU (phosphoserine phosphatase)
MTDDFLGGGFGCTCATRRDLLATNRATRDMIFTMRWWQNPLLIIVMATAPSLVGQTQPPAVFDFERARQPIVSLDGLWRFHPGDDPRWAESGFDDDQWPLIRSTEGWSDQGYKNMSGLAWYRARIVIPEGGQRLALYVPLISTSYQVFVDGQMIGQFGEMPPRERAYHGIPQTLIIPDAETAQAHTAVIAFRVWHWPYWARYSSGGLQGGLLIGRLDLIKNLSGLNADKALEQYTSVIVFGFIFALAGLTSLGLFALRPREKEYLWFGSAQIIQVALIWFGIGIEFHPFPVTPRDWVWTLLRSAERLCYVGFYYYLLRGRRGWSLQLAIGAIVAYDLIRIPATMFWSISPATDSGLSDLALLPAAIWIDVLVIRRAIQGFRDARLVAVPELIGDLFGLGVTAVSYTDRLGWSSDAVSSVVFFMWLRPFPIMVGQIVPFLFLLAMLAILIWRFARTSLQEERMAGELEAARSVQQVLIPEEIPVIPGFFIESVYKPAGEVGGDFFQVLPVKGDGVLAVIGDVSGKGMPAAMTVSLLVGTLRTLAHYTQSPGEILAGMNQRMLARNHGGFTTCLVLRCDGDGKLTIANAGHIAPYVAGKELALENGLPLGLAAESDYAESTFQLAPGEQLTLLTDGVVEARDKAGALFGFERSAALSIKSAEAIASAAQAFGQEDDITALTLTYAAAPAIG